MMIKTHHRVALLLILVWALVPLAILAAMMFTECSHGLHEPGDVARNAAFESLIDLPINQGLYISANRRKYATDDVVYFTVQNQTRVPLWFKDELFGVRGFVYNDTTQEWAEVDLGFRLTEPSAVRLQGSTENARRGFFLSPRVIDIQTTATVRLLVIGSTCPPEQQGQSDCQRYAAYTDIIVAPDR